jgi:hypothetical protein
MSDNVTIKATPADAFWAGLVKDETSATVTTEPVSNLGTITMANGGTRIAEWRTGQFTGRRYLQYRTPAGNWRNASDRDATTFVPAVKVAE